MTIKEFMKQMRMIQKNNKNKEIKIKVWMTIKWEYKERDLEMQDIVESNYNWETRVILAPLETFFR